MKQTNLGDHFMYNTKISTHTIAGVVVPSDLDINGFESGINSSRDDNFRVDLINATQPGW